MTLDLVKLSFIVLVINYSNILVCFGDMDINRNNSLDIFSCCSRVYGSCKTACENISLVRMASESGTKESKIQDIRKFCPALLLDFWECMNNMIKSIERGSQWSGRSCCPLAMSTRCQHACATAGNKLDLKNGCRQSDEQNLYSCLDRQEVGDTCCSNARTSECLQSCKDVFKKHTTPSKDLREEVQSSCSDNNPKILECIKNYTEVTFNNNLKQYSQCCAYSSNIECQKNCREVLAQSTTTEEETIDILETSGCGPPLPINPLWHCFLSAGRNVVAQVNSNEVSRINQIGLDSAKLHCCYKAISQKCGRLCISTYSNDWTETLDDFDVDCLGHLSESSLKQCIDEVDEPCELGCDGLSYCTNFNNRPTELFRSCTIQADNAAHYEVDQWIAQEYLNFVNLKLPIRNISHCSTDLWKSIACTLQLKPCTRTLHSNQICREDCYEILSKCVDWTKINSGHTVASLCHKLSPNDHDIPCVSIKSFQEPSDTPYRNTEIAIVSPCKGNPCNASQVCLVNRNGVYGYKCVTGCSLGEASSYLVSEGSFVRIPVSSSHKGCLKVCRCGSNGRIEKCQPLPCISYDSCVLAGKKFEHSSWFYVECNICSCFAGEITCTKKQCHIAGISSDRSFTSLPCNCPPHYVPVCGRNGNTYPSACIAKCTGLHDGDIDFGTCKSKDPCSEIVCGAHSTCIADRNVCLSGMHKPCPQHKCLNSTENCETMTAVRDTEMISYKSMCELLMAKRSFLYRDRYQTYCDTSRRRGLVCGVNGITYSSECEAWSDYSTVDYYGSCQEVGIISNTLNAKCSSIKCPKITTYDCNLIVPPGACCPICGTALRIIYSRKQIDRALYALKGKSALTLTLKSILRSLEEILQTAECRLSGYLTFENDIYVIIENLSRHSNFLQIEICTREAEKLVTLIRTQSHRITSELNLSALTVANLVKLISASDSSLLTIKWYVLICTVMTVLSENFKIRIIL